MAQILLKEDKGTFSYIANTLAAHDHEASVLLRKLTHD